MKTIITAAINGPTLHRGLCSTVPYTPREIAEEAERAWSAGASVVHVASREDGGSLSYRVERHREVMAAIRERSPVLVSMSTAAFGVGLEERSAVLEARPDLALLPIGSAAVARYSPRQKAFDYDLVFANPFSDVVALAARATDFGVRPIVACHDLGPIHAVPNLVDMGALTPGTPHALQLGLTGGMPANPQALIRMTECIAGPWSVSGSGSWPLLAGALALGGHLRVGFEDGWTLPDGSTADSNGALVEAAVIICVAVGSQVADVDDARRILGLG
ncbi:MAG: 3-keto-5-aminohexanoate cleavage enzyme [Myxococcota bacterium]|jgi:3-keto-5-aminohexanoate cleavage enzyme